MPLKNKLINWLAHRLPACKEVTRMASDAMDRKLPWSQWLKMRLHFLTCSLCLRYFKQLQMLRELAQQYSTQTEQASASTEASLSPATRERFKSMLKNSASE